MSSHLASPVFLATTCLYGLAAYNCIKVIGNRSSSGTAIAWILLNLMMPYIGVPLYFLLGDFRIKGYVKRHRARSKELDAEGAYALPGMTPASSDLPEDLRPTYTAFQSIFQRFGPAFAPQYGTATLLVDGRETFDAIFDAISNAKRYIIVQYYIVRHDRLGLELGRLLSAKARAGVRVFMLYDDLGSLWLSRGYIRDLRRAGVRVERFLPIASFKRFFQMNFRNHRKLVTVDGRIAFTGGLNVGEEYAARRTKAAKRRYWRDTHLSVTGGAVAQLEDLFFEDWYFATEEKIELGEELTASLPAQTLDVENAPKNQALQVIPSGPTDPVVISVLFLNQMINCAAKRLWIATPYFVPDPAVVRALELAALRGVDVRIMLPLNSDNRVVQWVSLSYAEQIQSLGVKVLLYTRGFMHQKVYLVDDSLAAVGTMNLDNRAMYLNFETMVLVHGDNFNGQVSQMLEHDFLTCRYLMNDPPGYVRRFKTLRADLARLLAPLL